jgi:hypothetical protein
MKPHKHAAIIKQWADGAQIQVNRTGGWVDTISPQWGDFIYRVKPEIVYPVTQLTPKEVARLYKEHDDNVTPSVIYMMNLAIQQAIDSGQVYINDVTYK